MTDDIETHDEMELAAEYALGLLSPEEAAAFESVLAVDPALRDLYADWAEDFADLTDDIAPVDPHPALEARIHAAIFGQPAPKPKPSLIARLGFFGPALAGVAAALAVLFGLNQFGVLNDDSPTFVAEIAAEDDSFVVLASFDPDAGTLDMNRTVGGPREGRALEVWLIAGENPPVSLGVWPKGQAKATLAIASDIARLMDGGVLAVSDEPPGGSPTGAPMGDVLGFGKIMLSH
ncbi:MAG: anti-sigma factor [Yoonia sp.]